MTPPHFKIKKPPLLIGVSHSIKSDFYYSLLTSTWTRLFFFLFLFYIFSNVIFGLLYFLSSNTITNGTPNSFLDSFFFSVQTMSTIGYGKLSPNGAYSNTIVTIEAAFGLIGTALVTGLVFARISRPQAKISFSKNIVFSVFNGVKCLSFRIGNTRGNDIVEAKVLLSALIEETTREGEKFRKIYDLKLTRNMTPFFTMSWSLFHPVDEHSPLFNKINHPSFIGIIVTVKGHDGNYSNTVYSRHTYESQDIIEGRYFKDIIGNNEEGIVTVNYTDFHTLR